jgi:hypothetical protein
LFQPANPEKLGLLTTFPVTGSTPQDVDAEADVLLEVVVLETAEEVAGAQSIGTCGGVFPPTPLRKR